MNSDQQGLLDAIIEHPYDDLPRLVYADWLEDNGAAAEAELIRLQHQSERLRAAGGDVAEREEVCRRACDLQREWEGGLQAALSAAVGGQWTASYEAGLLRLELSGGTLGEDGAKRLAELPALSACEWLMLSAAGLSAAGVAALAGSPHLLCLRLLDLSDNALGDGAGEALAGLASLRPLEALYLAGCGLGDPCLRHLAGGPAWKLLEELGLERNRAVGSAGVAALLNSGKVAGLHGLALHRTGVRRRSLPSLQRRFAGVRFCL